MTENSESDKDSYFSIGQLARHLDMSQRTIRYYEEIGLLSEVKRVEGGRRVYTRDDLQRLRFIKRLKLMGLSLAEMEELNAIFSIHQSSEKMLNRLNELLETHLKKIDYRIEDLKVLRNEIQDYKERIEKRLGNRKE